MAHRGQKMTVFTTTRGYDLPGSLLLSRPSHIISVNLEFPDQLPIVTYQEYFVKTRSVLWLSGLV